MSLLSSCHIRCCYTHKQASLHYLVFGFVKLPHKPAQHFANSDNIKSLSPLFQQLGSQETLGGNVSVRIS